MRLRSGRKNIIQVHIIFYMNIYERLKHRQRIKKLKSSIRISRSATYWTYSITFDIYVTFFAKLKIFVMSMLGRKQNVCTLRVTCKRRSECLGSELYDCSSIHIFICGQSEIISIPRWRFVVFIPRLTMSLEHTRVLYNTDRHICMYIYIWNNVSAVLVGPFRPRGHESLIFSIGISV